MLYHIVLCYVLCYNNYIVTSICHTFLDLTIMRLFGENYVIVTLLYKDIKNETILLERTRWIHRIYMCVVCVCFILS